MSDQLPASATSSGLTADGEKLAAAYLLTQTRSSETSWSTFTGFVM